MHALSSVASTVANGADAAARALEDAMLPFVTTWPPPIDSLQRPQFAAEDRSWPADAKFNQGDRSVAVPARLPQGDVVHFRVGPEMAERIGRQDPPPPLADGPSASRDAWRDASESQIVHAMADPRTLSAMGDALNDSIRQQGGDFNRGFDSFAKLFGNPQVIRENSGLFQLLEHQVAAPGAPADRAPVPLDETRRTWPDLEVERRIDGWKLGAGATAYPPGTRLQDVPPVLPSATHALRPEKSEVLMVLGIMTHQGRSDKVMQDLADVYGAPVRSVHNHTELGNSFTGGVVSDGVETSLDGLEMLSHFGKEPPLATRLVPGDWKKGLDWQPGTRSHNPATDTLAAAVYEKVKAGEKLHLVCESQGALITSNALSRAKECLVREGVAEAGKGKAGFDAKKAEPEIRAQVEGRMHDLVRLDNFSGAARLWTDGPRYNHFVNANDLVATKLGVGHLPQGDKDGSAMPWRLLDGLPVGALPGKGARVEHVDFHKGDLVSGVYQQHTMEDIWQQATARPATLALLQQPF